MGRQPATLRHWPLRAPKCPAHMNKAVCCLPASENPGKVAIEFRLLRACLASSCLDVFSTLPFFLELFPTSLCGVLVFRLAPAAPLPRPPAAVHLTHHTSLIKALLITPHSSQENSSHLTHHSSHLTHQSTTYHNSSQLHFSHLAYHISHRIFLITSHSTPHHTGRAQYTELPGGAAARRGWLSCGRRTTHTVPWRSCGARGRRWPAAGFRVAGALHRAFWRSCGARGRRWPAAGFCVAGAAHTP